MSECFWILTDGTVLIPASRHILAVVALPAVFGESEKTIRQTFMKYGQSKWSNVEGHAREEVLLRVIKRNNIRIRRNRQKASQYWSVQLDDLTEPRKADISAWARYIMATFAVDKSVEVVIHQLLDGQRIKVSLAQLAAEYPGRRIAKILTQSELSVLKEGGC